MKAYTVHVDIELPRDKVIELMDDPDNLPKWQNGLKSFEHVDGEPGRVGARSKLTYQEGKRSFELIETITKRDLPDEFNGTYEWGGGKNTLVNRFIALDDNNTRWESTCEYELRSVMLKLMALLMPGMFKRQNQKYLDNFKAFCEHGTDVREG